MTFHYRLTRSAKRDLREISDYWVENAGPDAAFRIVSGIFETIIALTYMPEGGHLMESFGEGVRRFPVAKYLVYYRPVRGVVEILHIFHGARDQRTAWKPKRR
ncbi:MAG TPA: type II toxin-antitoxin system RelE/ParE family toxin [Candidatus Solibacter sp.]|nr:type II toxin-antitoxin system RelE/ParE family toxin [Candidatus Solibacter sp.]